IHNTVEHPRDHPRVSHTWLVIAETQPLQRSGPEILDHHVGAGDQLGGRRLAGRRLEVEHHALLAAVDRAEGRAVVDRAPAAERVAGAWDLDLDHFGAEVGKHHTGIGTAHIIRELYHANAVQCSTHANLGHSSHAPWRTQSCEPGRGTILDEFKER